MKIKKQQLETLFNFTKGTEGLLNLADSRLRDSFLKPLADKTQEFFDDRDKIYQTFCIKNEDSTPDFKDGDKYQFEKSKLSEINKEILTLAEEEVEIKLQDNLPNSKLKEILEKSEYKPKALEAEVIDSILNTL